MKKFLSFALVGALVLGVSSVAYANICAFDPAPAASLLFPFVAFDFNNPISGTTTLMAITNVSSAAQIVHVTIWTDWSKPIFDFNIVLSGYDVQTMNIRDIIYFGELPDTHTSAYGGTPQPPVGNVSPPFSDGPVNFQEYNFPWLAAPQGTSLIASRCPSTGQAYPNYPTVPYTVLSLLQGLLSFSQTSARYHYDCAQGAEFSLGDWFESRTAADVTWMYITADVVWTCNRDFPDTAPDYWNFNCADPDYVALPAGFGCSTAGEKRVSNVLMGDIIWLNDALNFSETDNAIHLEADPFLSEVATRTPTTNYTEPISFYYRYSIQGGQQSDYREPLPTAWAFRYLGWQIDDIDTFIRAFKQGSHLSTNHPGVPSGTPKNVVVDLDYSSASNEMWARDCMAYSYFAWDEDENVTSVQENPWSGPVDVVYYPNLLPLETQEVSIDWFNFVDAYGWVMFIWPASNWGIYPGDAHQAWDTVGYDWYQTWMGVKYAAWGTYSMARSAAVMANFNCFSDQVYYGLGLDYDYVQQGFGLGYTVSPHPYN